MNRARVIIVVPAAIAAGLGVGWLDLFVTEVSVTILALLAAGLLLGAAWPSGAWLSAVLLALGLPAAAFAGLRLGVDAPEPIRLDPRIALVALAFAGAGCAAGAGLRRALARHGSGA